MELAELLKVKIIVSEGLSLQAAILAGQQPFTALITYAGRLSDKFVGGTEAITGGPFPVKIPPEVLSAKIKGLEGKRVFASEDLTSHTRAKYVGEFVSAWVEDLGNGLFAAKASGVLYRHIDPTLIDKIIELARLGQMGFSYDMKNVQYALKTPDIALAGSSANSETPHIELQDFEWRGATILKREAAAYMETQLAASKIDKQPNPDDPVGEQGEDQMDKADILKAIADGVVPAIKDLKQEILASAIDPLRTELANSVQTLTAAIEELKGKQALAAAGSSKSDEGKDDGKAVSGITAGDIATALKEAMEPLVEAVADLKASIAEKDEKKGFRKSLAAQHIDVLKKYGDYDEADEPTAENYQRAIDLVASDIRMSRDAKAKVLSELGGAKRMILRAGAANGGA